MGFANTLNDIFYEIIDMSSEMVLIAQGIGAIGALLYTAYVVLPVLASPGTEIDFMKALRPFAFALLLMLYPGFMGIFHTIPSLLSSATAKMVDNQRAETNASLGGIFGSENLELTQNPETTDDTPVVNSGGNPVELNQSDTDTSTDSDTWWKFSITGGLGEVVKTAMVSMFLYISRVIAGAVYFAIYFLRTLFLGVLYIFGPIIIALSIFPGMEGMFIAWIKRYISVHIWLPIAHIIEIMSLKVAKSLVVNTQYNTLLSISDDGTVSSPTMTAMLFLIFNILAFIAVPMLANMVINSGGAGNTASRLKRGAQAVATKGASLAKGK